MRGAVAMAYPGTDPTLGRQPVLHHTQAASRIGTRKYTVFGNVIKGMEVVDKIQVGDVAQEGVRKRGSGRTLTSPFRSG